MREPILPFHEVLCITNIRDTEPQETKLAGIVTAIVDPHNEVFPYFWEFTNDEPAIVIHIDKHDDMAAWVPILHENEMHDQDLLRAYAQKLSIADFFAPAMHHGRVSAMYHIDPRNDIVESYGNANIQRSAPLTDELNGEIRWTLFSNYFQSPKPRTLSYFDFMKEILRYRGKIILDIDLDAFECLEDDDVNKQKSIDKADLLKIVFSPLANGHLEKTLHFLKPLRKPGLITIARSSGPRGGIIFTPHYRVDALEHEVTLALAQLYR
ncbi:MAG: hypothetical protein ABIH34_04600 [Nanoarchaeota archaeon]